jgi:Domain of unknown function (DUF4115)
MRRGLELVEVAAELDIPSKSLRAVEWDRLDLLGDPMEAERIVQRYTAFLEGENGAVPAAEAADTAETAPIPGPPSRVRSALLFAGAAIPLVVVLVYLLGELIAGGDEPSRRQPEAAPRTTLEAPAPELIPAPPQTAQPKPPARAPVRLVLTAARGNSWVEARADSASGPLVFAGTLAHGRTLRLSGRRLWIRLGAATNVVYTLNGRPADTDLDLQGTVDVIVTPEGIQPA